MTRKLLLLFMLVASCSGGCGKDPSPSTQATLPHKYPVTCLAYSPDGTLLASGTKGCDQDGELQDSTLWGGSVVIWNTGTNKERIRIMQDQWVNAVAFSPDGKLLAVGSGCHEIKSSKNYTPRPGVVRFYDTITFKEKYKRIQRLGVFAIAFSPDGKYLAAGCSADPVQKPGEVTVWDLDSLEERPGVDDFKGGVTAVGFSSNSKILATLDWGDGSAPRIKLWDVDTGKVLPPLKDEQADALTFAYSPDGKTLATMRTVVRFWDSTTGQELPQIDRIGHPGMNPCLAFTPDSKRTAISGSMGDRDPYSPVTLWDLVTNKNILVWSTQGATVRCLAFSPDGKTLAAGCHDGSEKGKVILWTMPK